MAEDGSTEQERRAPVLRLIIAWKFARAALSLLGSLTVAVLVKLGLVGPVQRALDVAHDHAVSAVVLAATALLREAFDGPHLLVLAGVLILDAASLLLEGWALWRGWWWATWLVVGATTLPVPFEVVAMVRHPSLVRAGVMVVNLGIVAWLLTHRLRRRASTGALDAPVPTRPPAPREAP